MATSTLDQPKSPPPASHKHTAKAKGKPARPAPRPSTATDAPLEALCVALLGLLTAHQTTTSAPTVVVLAVLQKVLLLAQAYLVNGQGHLLATEGPALASLTWQTSEAPPPATPAAPPAPSSSTTATSPPPPAPRRGCDAAGPALHAFQRGAISDLAEAFDVWARIDQLAGGLALTVSTLDVKRAGLDGDLEEYATELRGEAFALGGSLCQMSAGLTGLSVRASPIEHAIRLREVLDLDDPPVYRTARQRDVLAAARSAFAATG